ncbi:MAG: XrtA/PEP-CTERM system histidine kinase PrsK [Gammaproteobacteria bacterium]|nr:XrtA/PEP-CTERM system histidine kinase PrsK [Gammaproteobacteria bacterium]
MQIFEFVSYLSGAIMFTILALLLVIRRLRTSDAALLFAVALLAAALFYGHAYAASGRYVPASLIQGLEVTRNAALFTYLFWLLGYRFDVGPDNDRRLPVLGVLLYIFAALMLGASIASPLEISGKLGLTAATELNLLGFVLLPVAGLVLVEQLFRNANTEQRWAIKFMCLGIGGLFVYDFYIYADALLFKRIDPALWSARGIVGAMVVPLIGISLARTQDSETRVFVSKRVVFHTATLMGAGVYLLMMAGAGYYIRNFGGTWGVALQTAFFFGAGLLLLVLIFSGQVRANIKFFLNKHFFGYKYDYREEWHKLIGILSEARQASELHHAVIRGVADIVESTGGQLWLKGDDAYALTAASNLSPDGVDEEPADGSMARFLADNELIIDIDEYRGSPAAYPGLELPGWLLEERRAWLVIPLFHPQGMLGFLVLARSRGYLTLNWEDMDLLKTVGRQAGSYLALLAVSEALADARQFETFNRLSAYVVHDLKNLSAQLSLVVTNARKHMHNPEFVKDAVQTVDNAVTKMNRLLDQLRKDRREVGPRERVDLGSVLEAVTTQRIVEGKARPRLEESVEGLQVVAERERLSTVLGHLVQNAQEASGADDEVLLGLKCVDGRAVIEVRDRGKGMDAEFIRNKLFRPFYTTKGNAGMGIGAYEAREYIRSQGGELHVESVPGQGTVFRIRLDIAPPSQH